MIISLVIFVIVFQKMKILIKKHLEILDIWHTTTYLFINISLLSLAIYLTLKSDSIHVADKNSPLPPQDKTKKPKTHQKQKQLKENFSTCLKHANEL